MPATEFSDGLLKRVLAFQRAHGLPQDGRLSADDWTKLAEVAATSAEPVPEPAAVAEPVAAPVVAQAVARPEGLNPADYPVLHGLATHSQDEASMKAYLLSTTGLDIDEIVGNITTVLEEAGA
jgi:hypothetical protein